VVSAFLAVTGRDGRGDSGAIARFGPARGAFVEDSFSDLLIRRWVANLARRGGRDSFLRDPRGRCRISFRFCEKDLPCRVSIDCE